MTITNRDGIINGLASGAQPLLISKQSISGRAVTEIASLWRVAGAPAPGAIPGAAAVCTSSLTGAFEFANPLPPAAAYLAQAWYVSTLNGTSLELHDRLAHMGGLSGSSTAPQGGLTLASLPVARRGSASYAEVQWWLEWYADTGATAVSASVDVTYDDGSNGTLATVALDATTRASRLVALRSNVPGRNIRAVNSVTLSASTGAAGNFGVTATRSLAAMMGAVANKIEAFDWAALGLPRIENDSCLMLITQCSASTTGVIRGGGKIVLG